LAVKKGKEFERETAALAGKRGKRIPMSGSIGTVHGIDKLAGDAIWKLPWLNSNINIESKHGYGDKNKEVKSIRVQREWFEKHLGQAKALNFYPAFAMKFKFTHEDGLSKFILIPFPTMKQILEEMENLWLELEELRAEKKAGNK